MEATPAGPAAPCLALTKVRPGGSRWGGAAGVRVGEWSTRSACCMCQRAKGRQGNGVMDSLQGGHKELNETEVMGISNKIYDLVLLLLLELVAEVITSKQHV